MVLLRCSARLWRWGGGHVHGTGGTGHGGGQRRGNGGGNALLVHLVLHWLLPDWLLLWLRRHATHRRLRSTRRDHTCLLRCAGSHLCLAPETAEFVRHLLPFAHRRNQNTGRDRQRLGRRGGGEEGREEV